MSKDTVRVLTDALALIDAPEKWCQGVAQIGAARCADRALCDVARQERHEGAWQRYNRGRLTLQIAIGQTDILTWNDRAGRTHAEVVAAFQRAIEIAEAAE